MSNKDYKQIILDGLLKKYNNRYAKNIITNRRIILKPKEVYKDYAETMQTYWKSKELMKLSLY